VNGICIGQRNCGDAIVSGVTLVRAAQQIRPVRPDISDHMKVRTAAQILGVGAGVRHELMKRRFSPSIRLKSKRQVGMIDTIINRFPTIMQKPTVTMTVQTLPGRVDPCLDARQVLQGAIQKGLKLEPAALAALARLQ
jgi:hypothetical protein